MSHELATYHWWADNYQLVGIVNAYWLNAEMWAYDETVVNYYSQSIDVRPNISMKEW